MVKKDPLCYLCNPIEDNIGCFCAMHSMYVIQTRILGLEFVE